MSVIPSDIAYYGSYCDPAYDGSSTLSAAITTTTAASLTVTSASTFPPAAEFFVLVDSEIMLVTQVSGTTFTIIRGMCGTTAATHLISANITMPSGGGIDLLTKVSFSDVTSGDKVDYVSTSTSDTLVQITTTGRDTTGVIQTETKTLNGQTIVNGTQVWDRLEIGRLAAGTTTTAQIASGGTTLAVTAHANFPTSGNYNIQMGREIMTVTAGQNTNSWTVTRGVAGTTATVHQSGDNVYLVPVGDVAIVDHTAVIAAHTCQSGSANPSGTTPAIMKLQSGDGASAALGQVILTTSGTGSHQIRTIIGLPAAYGTDTVAVSRSWGTVPDNTTVYTIYNGMQLDLSPNQSVECRRFLWNSAADIPGGSQRIFYQQIFAMNNNTATALTGATAQVASNSPSLPSGALLDLATATSANDAQSVTSRQTAFSTGYGSYVTQPSATAYGANSGNLASGAAPNTSNCQGIILRLTLPAGTTSYKGAADLRTLGNTI